VKRQRVAVIPRDLARSLSGVAVRVWREMRADASASITYEEAAERLRISKSTVAKALRELERKGLVVCMLRRAVPPRKRRSA
jgi:predicted transcriptional regulator